MLDFFIIILLLLLILLGALNLYLSNKNSSEHKYEEVLEKQENSLINLNNDIQSFKEPLSKLRNFLSGGTQAGSFGEWNLESIIKDIFSENQYVKNIEIIPKSGQRVEFAIRLQDGLLMPIDAKFPSGLYNTYLEATESMDVERVRKCKQQIERHIKNEAKSISEKYTQEGITTDHAIMYLPSESLFQLIMSLNIKEEIFRDFKILMLGPNSLAAYIISIHMGFRTLALNERTTEIIKEFGQLKKEFEKFSNSTDELRKKADSMIKTIDAHEIREKQMSRSLERMERLDEDND